MSILNEHDIDPTQQNLTIADAGIPMIVQVFREAFFVHWCESGMPDYIRQYRHFRAAPDRMGDADDLTMFLNNCKIIGKMLGDYMAPRIRIESVECNVMSMITKWFANSYITTIKDEFAHNYIIYNRKTENCIAQVSIVLMGR